MSNARSNGGEYLTTLLKHAYLRVSERVAAALAPLGVDGREFAVLNALDGLDPVSQLEVGRRLGVDRTTMVALVDGLEGKGLVLRQPHPDDRRKNAVTLTEAGRETTRRAAKAVGEVEARFLAPLPAGAAEPLKASLRALLGTPPDRG